MDIKVGDYVTLKPWAEVKDTDTLGIGMDRWNKLYGRLLKVISITRDKDTYPSLCYYVEDTTIVSSFHAIPGWYVLESAIASVRRDFK